MPFFCFIVYNGHTLCLINVIGPINVFGKFIFVNIFQFLHFGCPCKINFFYISIFLQKSELFYLTGISWFKTYHIFVGEMISNECLMRLKQVRETLQCWFAVDFVAVSEWKPHWSPPPPFGLIISQSMKHTSCVLTLVWRKTQPVILVFYLGTSQMANKKITRGRKFQQQALMVIVAIFLSGLQRKKQNWAFW